MEKKKKPQLLYAEVNSELRTQSNVESAPR